MGEWDGVDQRAVCSQHHELTDSIKEQTKAISEQSGDMKVITKSLEIIATNLTDNRTISRNIILAFIGVIVTIILAITGGIYTLGGQGKQIEVNTKLLNFIVQDQFTKEKDQITIENVSK
jgi:hypothetical protein